MRVTLMGLGEGLVWLSIIVGLIEVWRMFPLLPSLSDEDDP